MGDLFPLGWQHYLIGGLLIGAGTGLVFLAAGVRMGASTFFSSTLTYFLRGPAFQDAQMVQERGGRSLFTLGLLLGAAAYTVVRGETFTTAVGMERLFVGGVLVGLGTRLSRGCTSGHGICGISSGSRPSILAVLVFMGVAMGVAHLVKSLGVTP